MAPPRSGGGPRQAPAGKPPPPPRPPNPDRSPKVSFSLQLRLVTGRRLPDRKTVFETTFGKLNAPLTRLNESKTGYYATTDRENIIDLLLTTKSKEELAKVGLEPVLPPEVRAKRTIFVRQLDGYVGSHTAPQLLTELKARNNGLKVTDVIKIKDYTHVIKLLCDDVNTADRILTTGLYAFNTRITPDQCERETYTHIQICYKCYAFETHTTKDCTATNDVCSECAQTGHTHRDCTNTTKKCLNCPNDSTNDHRTLAARCPYRKKTIADKRTKLDKDNTNKQNSTYAQVAKLAVEETKKTAPPPNHIRLTNKTQLKMTALILEAHIASLTEPHSYSKILSDSLKLNFDIDAKFPDRNSQQIFNMYIGGPDVSDMLDTPDANDTSSSDSSTDEEMEDENAFEDDDNFRRSSFDLTHGTAQPDQPPVKTSTNRRSSTKPKRKASDSPVRNELSSVWTGKRLGHRLTQTINADTIGLKLIRSSIDKRSVPNHITTQFLHTELNKDVLGLKIEAEQGKPDTIKKLLLDGTLKVTGRHFTVIPHNDFLKLPKARILTMKDIPPKDNNKACLTD